MRCTAGLNTFAANVLLPGRVRSGAPNAVPLALHWAAVTLCWRVLGIGGFDSLLKKIYLVGIRRIRIVDLPVSPARLALGENRAALFRHPAKWALTVSQSDLSRSGRKFACAGRPRPARDEL